jgi:hypothetical protein
VNNRHRALQCGFCASTADPCADQLNEILSSRPTVHPPTVQPASLPLIMLVVVMVVDEVCVEKSAQGAWTDGRLALGEQSRAAHYCNCPGAPARSSASPTAP